MIVGDIIWDHFQISKNQEEQYMNFRIPLLPKTQLDFATFPPFDFS